MFFISGYSSLFTVVPVKVMAVASQIVAIFTYASAMIGCLFFSVISQNISYSAAFIFLSSICLIMLVFSWIVYIVDKQKQSILRNPDGYQIL